MTLRLTSSLPYDIDDPALVRATWSRLAEPASAAATMLVDRLGPSAALRWLLEEAIDSSGRVRSAPRPPVPEPPPGASRNGGAGAHWAQVAARWAPRLEGLDIRRELDVLDRLGGASSFQETPGGLRGSTSWSSRPSACGCVVTRRCWSVAGSWRTRTLGETGTGSLRTTTLREPRVPAGLCVSTGCRQGLPAGCVWLWWGPEPPPGTVRGWLRPWPRE